MTGLTALACLFLFQHPHLHMTVVSSANFELAEFGQLLETYYLFLYTAVYCMAFIRVVMGNFVIFSPSSSKLFVPLSGMYYTICNYYIVVLALRKGGIGKECRASDHLGA